MCRLSSGSAKADSGLVGHGGDSFGSQHRRELVEHVWQAPGRQDWHAVGDHLAPGDLGAVDSHDWDHDHVGIGQDLGGPVGSNATARRIGARG